jgi:hypothetical protein
MLEFKGPLAFLKRNDLDATQNNKGVSKNMALGFLKLFIFASRDKFVNASRYNMQMHPIQ